MSFNLLKKIDEENREVYESESHYFDKAFDEKGDEIMFDFQGEKKELSDENIVRFAFDNFCTGMNVDIFIDFDEKKVFERTYAGNTEFRFQNDVICIYDIENNFVGNEEFEMYDLIDDQEWEELKKMFGDDADYHSKKQLSAIGIDITDRYADACISYIE